MRILLLVLFITFTNVNGQNFPNPATLSTGQGVPGTYDVTWEVNTQWLAVEPTNTLLLNYTDAYINNNCAPGFWVEPSLLPPPVNNGNWITSDDATCGNNTSGYRVFRLPLDLPSDCNGNPISGINNYILYFSGYVDNVINNIYVNGTPKNISGGNFFTGDQLNFQLNGPWISGINYIDIVVQNYPSGGVNPFGLLMVADSNQTSISDIDNDGISDLYDLCPCQPGALPDGCCSVPNIITVFTQVPAICSGATLSALPTTSNNGVSGTWSPALNNTTTTTYTFTPDSGQCATTTTMTINVISNISPPTGNASQIFCASSPPTISDLTATGTAIQWYAAATGGSPLASTTNLVDGVTYYASQTVNGCDSTTRFAVIVTLNDPQITASASSICIGETVNLNVNYTTSTLCNMNITPNTIPLGNPIPGFTYGGNFNGHYYYVYNSPTLWTEGELICRQNGGYLVCINDIVENNFVSNLTNNNIWIGMFRDPTTCEFRWLDCMDITFTNWRPGEPNSGPCGEPYTQIIRGCSFGLNTWNNLNDNSSNGSCYSNMVPIMEIDPTYYTQSVSSLVWSTGETTSNINVSPTSTSTYWVDVTIDGVTCRDNFTITVNPEITPTFTQEASICSGATISALPTSSINGFTGTWSPALNNTTTTTYTFTPAAGQCATTETMTITVNPNITPTFTQVPAICSGATLSALPTTSSNGINGTWSPALNNTATTTYTFTPTASQCATTATMTITVNQLPLTPTGTSNQSFCAIDGPTINDLVLNTTNVNWYTSASGGLALNSNFPLTNGLVLYAAAIDPITLCENPTRYQVQIQVENPALPTIASEQVFCLENNLTLADINTNGTTMNWYNNPTGGSVVSTTHVLQNGDVFYGAAINSASGCESTTRIPLEITIIDSNLSFFNLITIDDNDLNKELIIQGLEQFPNNSIEIYNRYGNLVWTGVNYNNVTNTFKGMASVSGVVSQGSYLPTGTYFFILSYPNDCEKSELKGFIQIDNKR